MDIRTSEETNGFAVWILKGMEAKIRCLSHVVLEVILLERYLLYLLYYYILLYVNNNNIIDL